MLAPQTHSSSLWAVRTYSWGSQALTIWPWTRNLGEVFHVPLPQTLNILRPHSRPALLSPEILFIQGFFKEPLSTSQQGKGNSVVAAAVSTQTVSTTVGTCLSAEVARKWPPRLLAPEGDGWADTPEEARTGRAHGEGDQNCLAAGMTRMTSRGRHRADSRLAARRRQVGDVREGQRWIDSILYPLFCLPPAPTFSLLPAPSSVPPFPLLSQSFFLPISGPRPLPNLSGSPQGTSSLVTEC